MSNLVVALVVFILSNVVIRSTNMAWSFKKWWSEYKPTSIVMGLVILGGLFLLVQYLGGKGLPGSEGNAGSMPAQFKGQASSAVQPADPSGGAQFASASGLETTMPSNMPSASMQLGSQNPADLLPKDTHSQWAQLNPSGKGELANIHLFKAGHQIGINTVSSSLRNPSLQIRSDPVIPQVNTGPWNQTTIEPDVYRRPLEIGQGPA